MDFKFFSKNNNNFITNDGYIRLQPQVRYENVEFCFQFGEDEPVSFMTGSEYCQITIDNTSGGHVTFTDNNKTFKLFARERQ